MAFQTSKIVSGGVFFKPAEHINTIAILIEPKSFVSQVPTMYGPKDTVYADMTVFKDQASLDAGTPEILVNAVVQNAVLAKDLVVLVDGATIQKVSKEAFKSGFSGYVWREVDADVEAKVIAFATKREEAAAAAMADAPDF